MVLRQFKREAEAAGALPVLLFFPTLEHVYGRFTTDGSDATWNARRAREVASEDHREATVTRLANAIDLRMISLTPAFKQEAAAGRLLYYRADTHWNSLGRQVGAATVASQLKEWLAPAVRK